MSKIKKRLTAMAVLTAMFLMMFPQISFGVTWKPQEIPPEFKEVIYFKDGKNAEDMRGAFSLTKDSTGNECYSVGNASYIKQLFFNFDKLVSQGVSTRDEDGQYMVSFDIQMKQKEMGLQMYIDDITNGANFSAFCMSGNGKFYINNSRAATPAGTFIGDNPVDYEPNRWYNIKYVHYTNERYMDFYIDNVYWGRAELSISDSMNTIYSDRNEMHEIFFNTRPDWKLDKNGTLAGADASGVMLMDNFTYGFPVKRTYEIDYWKNEIGNIYDGKNVNFGCDLYNRTEKAEKFTFEYDIRTDMNKQIKKGKTEYELKPGEKQAVTLLDYAPEYGFYICDAKLYNSEGELVFEESTRFSIISPQNGVNKQMGINLHNTGHGDASYGPMPYVLEVTKKLGIGNTRDGYNAVSIYQDDGMTRISGNKSVEYTNKYFPVTGNKNLAMLYSWTDMQKTKYEDEKAKELLSKYAKFCRQIALDLDPEVTPYFELENEWWLHGDLNYSGVKYDVNISSDVKLYAEMIKIANREIKAVNPNAKISMGDFTLISSEFAHAVLDALGPNPGQYFDAIAIHDYMASLNGVFPEQYMESGGAHNGGTHYIHKLIKEYGLEDKEIWSTEYGTTSGYHIVDVDIKLNGDYYVRHYMYDTQYMDLIYMYQLIRDRWPSSDYEGGFGILDRGTAGDVKWGALPAAIELAAYNTLLNKSEYVSTQIIGNDGTDPRSEDIYIYKHKTANGKDCYAIFNATSQKNVSFDFGVQRVDVYDEYGNKTTLDALDGYITMNVTTAPKYVVANDLKDEVGVREKPLFDKTFSVTSALDDMFSFDVTKDTNAKAEISIECSANTGLGSMDSFTDRKSTVNMLTYNNRIDVEEYKFDDYETKEEIIVSISDGNKLYYKDAVLLSYVDSLESELKLMPYRNGRWQGVLKVKNNKKTSSISGTVETSTGDKFTINNLLSGQRNIIRFNIPENVEKKNYTASTKIALTDGTTVDDTANTNFISVEKAYAVPNIDGKLDNGEWKNSGTLIKLGNNSPYIILNKNDSTAAWDNEDDLSGEMYLMYDDTYFYLAAKVKDDVHCGNDEQGRAWAMDSIQFGISKALSKSSEYTEIGISLSDAGETILQKYKDVNEAMVYFDPTKINEFDKGTEYKATLDGNVTIYELKIPWTELTQDSKAPKEYLIFSTIINENDGKGRNAFMEWELASGIGKGKDPSAYTLIPMNN